MEPVQSPGMLVIRLARGGRSKYPTYRIVAAESARAATGKFVEILGHYNPHTKELVIKKEETMARLSHGAQPSNTVIKLLQREKIDLPVWAKLKTKTPKPKAEETPEVKAEVVEEAAPEAEAKDETRVAEAATANAAATEDNAPSPDTTETAETTEAAAEAAEATEDAGVEPAEDTADEAAK